MIKVNRLKIWIFGIIILAQAVTAISVGSFTNPSVQTAGVGIVVILVFWIMLRGASYSKTNRILEGTRYERGIERKWGFLWRDAKRLGQASWWLGTKGVQAARAGAKKLKVIAKRDRKDEAVEDADEAAEQLEEGEGAEAQAEEFDIGLQSAAARMDALLMELVSRIKELADDIEGEERKQERYTKIEEGVVQELNRAGNNFSRMDTNVAGYVYRIINDLIGVESQDEAKEAEKLKRLKEAIGAIKKAIDHIQTIENEMEGGRKRIAGLEKKEKKDFRRELKKLKEAIKAKKRELKERKREAKKEGKEMGEVIASLKREIGIMQRALGYADSLDGRLKQTYDMMKANLGNLKNIDNQIKGAAKSMKAKRRTFDDYEKKLEEAEKHMREGTANIRRRAKEVQGEKEPFAMVVPIIGEISHFMKEDEKIVTFDYNFRNTLASILDIGFEVCQRTESFIRIVGAMEEAEIALDNGTDGMIQVMGSILTNAAESDLMNLKININGQEQILSNAKQINKDLEDYTKMIEARIAQTKARLSSLGSEERTLYAAFDRVVKEASYAIAVMAGYKERTDLRYLSQAQRFSDALGTYNNATATMTRRAA